MEVVPFLAQNCCIMIRLQCLYSMTRFDLFMFFFISVLLPPMKNASEKRDSCGTPTRVSPLSRVSPPPSRVSPPLSRMSPTQEKPVFHSTTSGTHGTHTKQNLTTDSGSEHKPHLSLQV